MDESIEATARTLEEETKLSLTDLLGLFRMGFTLAPPEHLERTLTNVDRVGLLARLIVSNVSGFGPPRR